MTNTRPLRLAMLALGLAAAAMPSQAASRGPHVVPPINCTTSAETANFTTGPIVDVGVVTFTATVGASADNYIWDVDLNLNITHTFNGDLDITLQSPAGTIVTITTDNGGGTSDVFAGTLFDDQADPDGQVPYTHNDGLVTDSLYANLVVETPLVPEEHLSAFIGEEPAGVWTLTISDDATNDVGALVSGSLTVTRMPAAAVSTSTGAFSNTTPVAIPAGPAVVTSTLLVSGMDPRLCRVVLTTAITHTFNNDLAITLQSPAGTFVTITTDNGGDNDNVFNGTEWRDDANPGGQVPYTNNDGLVTDSLYTNLVVETPLVPEEAFAAVNGQDPNGTWLMTISDDAFPDGGSLDSWSLALTACGCPVPVQLQKFSIE